MTVIEKFANISSVMDGLIEFIQVDEDVKSDFDEYLNTIGAKNCSQNQLQSISLPYIFERNINSKSVLELYLDKNKKAPKNAKAILDGLAKSLSAIFEIKKVSQHGFELYNLINEKTYKSISLVKMKHFRGLGVGQFIVARIFEFSGEYYLLEISNALASNQGDEAMRFAIAKIIQSPELVYLDNPQKLKEIETQVETFNKNFMECFETDEIITTNKLADDVIGIFNDYNETKTKPSKKELKEKIQALEEYKFFEVGEFQNSYENFLENSLGGFAAHSHVYDVAVIFDEDLGLYAIPFYKTFCEIFEAKDYKKIEGYKKCVEHFLLTDSISANILSRVEKKYKNFMEVINQIEGTSMTFNELLKKYKSAYLKQKIFSSTTVLYVSQAFSKTLGYIEASEQKGNAPASQLKHLGRNELCPCGSGKKYKKCCLGQ